MDEELLEYLGFIEKEESGIHIEEVPEIEES